MKRLLALLLFVPSLCLAQLPDYVPNTGLIGWYPLDGDADDLGPLMLHGTIHGPAVSEDRFGQPAAMSFDGQDDHLSMPQTAITGDDSRTFSVWIKGNVDGGGYALSYGPELANGGGCMAGNHLEIQPGDCQMTGVGINVNCTQKRAETPDILNNTWHHVVMVYDGGGFGEIQLWLDGTLLPEPTCTQGTFPPALSTSNLFGLSVGKRNYDPTPGHFDGSIDDVGIWNRALSEAEIQALHTSVEVELPEHVPTEGLVAWYPFSGDVLDNSGQGLHLTQESAQFCPDRNGEQDAAMEFGATVDPLFSRLHFDGLLTDVADDFSMAFWGNPFESTNLPSQGQTGNENYPEDQMAWHPIHGQHFGPEDDHSGLGFGIGTNGIAFTEHSSAWTSAPLVVEVDLSGWHHYAVVVEAGVPKLSIDGGPFVVGEASGRSLHLSLGIDPYYPDGGIGHGFQINAGCATCNRYDGQLDDIGIWDRALTLGEIQGIASATQPGCGDPEACNYTPDNAEAEVQNCEYCSCVGEFLVGASFSNPIVAHGAQALYTPWGAGDLSGVEGTSVTKLVGGEDFMVALKEDGTVAVINPETSPDPLPFGQPAVDIAAGRGSIAAVLEDGSVVDFSNNSTGDFITTDMTDAVLCARSWNFGMVLKEDGSLDGWGAWHPSPEELTDIVAIDAGVSHAVALTADGRIHEWAYDGQIGEVITSAESIAALTGIVDISAGTNATMAIFEDGSAQAWTWPEGTVYQDIPASEGVVDGAVNWSIFTYITYDGRSVTSSNFGDVEVQLDTEPQIECGVCIYDFDGNGLCNEGAVLGCIDPLACNYSSAHTIDDGSCLYPPIPQWSDDTVFTLASELLLTAAPADSYSWFNGSDSAQALVDTSGWLTVALTNVAPVTQSSLLSAPGTCGMVTPEAGWKDQGMTLGCWILTDDPGRGYILMEGNDGWADDFGIALQMIDGYIEFDANAINHGLSDTYIADGQWHAMHVTCEADTARFYIDGTLQQEVSLSGGLDLDAWPILLGTKTLECSTDDGSNSVFEGALSRLALWSRPLSAEEMQSAMDCGEATVPSGLVGYWPLEENATGTLVAEVGTAGTHHEMASLSEAPAGFCGCTVVDSLFVTLAPTLCGAGTVWDPELGTCVSECTETQVQGQCGAGTVWDPINEECIIAIPTDNDLDGCIAASDVLNLLSTFGSCPPIPFSGPCQGLDHVTYHGYDYDIVAIGDQCWFAENLRTELYANGDSIPASLSDGDWTSTDAGATAVYGEGNSNCTQASPVMDPCDEGASLAALGRLYNWFAVDDSRNLCPTHWHVPTDSDWMDLEMSSGMDSLDVNNTGWRGTDEGLKLKSSIGWNNGGNGQDAVGFNAQPAGGRHPLEGRFLAAGEGGYFWTSTPDGTSAWIRRLTSDYSQIDRWPYNLRNGYSVRCVKD